MTGINYAKELYKATVEISSQKKTIELLQADNKSLSDAAQQLKNMIETFGANFPSIQAEAAKAAIYALFEVGNCPQYENGAGDGYIECGDALKFADKYAEQILSGEVFIKSKAKVENDH